MELRMKLTRTRVALAVVAVALAATGSVGWAAIGEGGTVQGCVAGNGTIDAIDPVTQACRDRQTPVEWYTKAGADAAFVNNGEGANVRGYESVAASNTAWPNQLVSASASCPQGKVAVGGGFDAAEGLTVLTSRPTFVVRVRYDENGRPYSVIEYEWYVLARNATATSQQLQAFVTCVSG